MSNEKTSAEFADVSASTSSGEYPSGKDSHVSSSSLQQQPTGCSAKWTRLVSKVHAPIVNFLLWLSNKSARNPRSTIAFVTILSFSLVIIGFLTNFEVDVDESKLWTPANSRVLTHSDWIETESGFAGTSRPAILFIHADTGNVLGQEQVANVFTALDTIRNLPDYGTVCADTPMLDRYGRKTCPITGVTTFWNDTSSIYASQVSSDEESIAQMSQTSYPDGTPVDDGNIFGLAVRDDTGLLSSARAYSVVIELPGTDATEDFEEEIVDAILALADQWDADPSNNLRLEFTVDRSFPDEFERAILQDIPLIPVVFTIMSIFCCLFFFKKDKVRSRTLLGLSAVIAVLLSMVSGFGLLFICGVPFTSMTQLLPFVIFGIGLDDSFIMAGSFDRTDATKDAVDRIHDTIEDVGASITLTTISTTMAFVLGSTSSIPAVFWLCYYAFPTVLFVFLYQVTFFVACLVLDTRRIEQNRRDFCTCVTVARSDDDEVDTDDRLEVEEGTGGNREESLNFFDNMMGKLAEQLLKPVVQVPLILIFMGLLGGCAYSATLLTQEFAFTDVLPSDSYLTDFQQARESNTARSIIAPFAYFRFVNQGNEDVQRQMEEYVDELTSLEAIVDAPQQFWLKDFQSFVSLNGNTELDFPAQVDLFLADPIYGRLYNDHIVRDDSGSVTASRVRIFMDNLDIEDVEMQVDTLKDQRAISAAQPSNKDRNDWSFFTYDGNYNIWEFYGTTVEEIILTTIVGVTSVTLITLLFVPHWTAALFVFPLISILYVDLLGLMQFAGVHINAVSYISLVMSIGLMVDFLLHVLLRYYESPGNRKEKVVNTLRTMGASVLVGGISTFLGTLPLVFSTSTIFNTVFITFVGLVTLGCTHGLVLLPILLAIFGPEEQVLSERMRKSMKKEQVESSPKEGSTDSIDKVVDHSLQFADDGSFHA